MKLKNIKTKLTLLLSLTSFIAVVCFSINTQIVLAAEQTNSFCGGEASNFLNFPTWYKYLDPHYSNGECNLDISFPDSLPLILLAIFEILLRIAGFVAVIFVLYGGFQYLTTAGEPDKAKAARTTIINALVGTMIAMMATVIVNLIGRSLVR